MVPRSTYLPLSPPRIRNMLNRIDRMLLPLPDFGRGRNPDFDMTVARPFSAPAAVIALLTMIISSFF